jgi:hypothetical protein
MWISKTRDIDLPTDLIHDIMVKIYDPIRGHVTWRP